MDEKKVMVPEKDKEEGKKIFEKILDVKDVRDELKVSKAEIELIKRTIAVNASDDELKLFIQICRGAKLNPFMKQAHFVPFWDSKTGTEKRAVIIGIDGFRTIAEDSGNYAGNDDPIFKAEEQQIDIDVYESKGQSRHVVRTEKLKVPSEATVSVYKVVCGIRCPFTATARWSEYYPGSKKVGRWHTMPYLMLGKCAEALALRKAFPSRLSGVYSQEEMDQAITSPTADKIKKTDSTFKLIVASIGKMKIEELESYKEKMLKSDKYTDEQKKQFSTEVDKKIEELKNTK